MKSLYVAYEKAFDDETSTWILVGKDSKGGDFGVSAAPQIEVAEERLRDWVLDSLMAAADDGEDQTSDLSTEAGDHAIAVTPIDLLPIYMRLHRAKRHMSQAEVAEKLGISQQAYSKYERPGANLELKTIQQVERAIDEELLEFA